MATEPNRFPVEELLRNGPPGARAPTPSELRRASGVDERDNLTRSPLRRPPPRTVAPASTERDTPRGYTYMGDAASAGPRRSQRRGARASELDAHELRGSGIREMFTTTLPDGTRAYSDRAPVGETAPVARSLWAQGERVDRVDPSATAVHDRVQADQRQYREAMSAHEQARREGRPATRPTQRSGNPYVHARHALQNTAPEMSAENAMRIGREQMARYGTPQEQRDAALARGEKPVLSNQELIARANAHTALAEAQGKAARAPMEQHLASLAQGARADEFVKGYAEHMERDYGMTPEQARLEATRMATPDGVHIRDTPTGRALEAAAARRIQDVSQRLHRNKHPGEDISMPPIPLDQMQNVRDLTFWEKFDRQLARWTPNWYLEGLGGVDTSDIVAAYDDATPEGRKFTRYLTARDRATADALNEWHARQSRRP